MTHPNTTGGPRTTRDAGERGVVALITVIIIGIVILMLGLTSAEMARTDIILSGYAGRGRAALALATSCAEEALFRVKLDGSYAGGSIPFAEGTCTSTVTGSGSSRTIVADGAFSGHARSIQMDVSLQQDASGQAHAWRVDSWTELDP